ncbi:MAG: putative oxidoreductase YjmC [Opitutia bacterium UBA7350]|nr:MAG: putative oxidoreductase YjmC [Opitutae bacterium UBA7350]
MTENFQVIAPADHNAIVKAAYLQRGFDTSEAEAAARFSEYATCHGIRTHNAIKALHLDHLFGSEAGGCVPGAEIEVVDNRFGASEVWNANKKLGQATAYAAMNRAIELAEQYGIGQVSVDNAFHYLWGGGYVMDAAKRGYIAYTNCTAALAEVVPYKGKFPTLGTNPHSWGFPTCEAIGFPIVIDWATSVVSMGRVQQFLREGSELPKGSAVDAKGNLTADPAKVEALIPFGEHKGYGLSLINEIVAGFIGGSLPTLRSREIPPGEKRTPTFYFKVIHPDALNSGIFAQNRNQAANVKAVIQDILGHGNENCLLPGQLEAGWAKKCHDAGGLLFSDAEIEALNLIATECGAVPLNT